jgi:hypothetical protein
MAGITSELRLQMMIAGDLEALGSLLHVQTPVCIAFQ